MALVFEQFNRDARESNRPLFLFFVLVQVHGVFFFFSFSLGDSLLICTKATYQNCRSNMKMISRQQLIDHNQWYCGKDWASRCCKTAKSVRYDSFFFIIGSKLPIPNIIQMICEFFMGSSVETINQDLNVHEHNMASWC